MKKTVPILAAAAAWALFFAAPGAQASPQCVKEYEDYSLGYWRIADDMMQFKVMFDNYDRLCSLYYPDEMKALHDSAVLLRRRVADDVKNMDRVIGVVFKDVLPKKVSPECSKDEEAGRKVKDAFLSMVKGKTKTMSARMERSAATVRDPDRDLKLCRDLGKYKPILEKKLGSRLANPLLEASYYNNILTDRKQERLKESYATYRDILNYLPRKD